MVAGVSEFETCQSARRARARWFPLAWLVLVSAACLGVQVSSEEQDIKNTAIMLCFGAFFLGWSTWQLLCSGQPVAQRLFAGLVPWVAALAFFSSIELVNNGDIGFVGWRWRWGAKPDEKLVAPQAANTLIADWQTTPQDYPRFLGNGYWAEASGAKLAPDWSSQPPHEIWRRKIGAGWSGFALVGNYAITQEQRGDQELVVCYRIMSDKPQGEIVWTHADTVRFDPSGAGALGGIGPRATPTVHDGRVFSMGATGIINCLDARSGEQIWSHDTLAETDTLNVMWGKASSPLIVHRDSAPPMVVVSVGAPGESLVAYDVETGKKIWSAGDKRSSYATPVLTDLLGEQLILSVNEDLITAHEIENGTVMWTHDWPGNSDSDATVSQPIPLPGDRLFLSKGYGVGSSLLQMKRDEKGNIVSEPVWSPGIRKVMKTKMGNAVIRGGYVYGLDGGILQCIDLAEGRSQWKKRRAPAIGHGQIMLVGDAIVVLSESGELILVEPNPEEYRELAAMRVFPPEQVTWNNPAFSSPFLLLRNAEQAVCLKMPLLEPYSSTVRN
jgi:outer membrane protein assembly factor BamB